MTIPSTFNYVQTVLWISVHVGKHISKGQLLNEVERFNSINPKVEPPLHLVRRDLTVAHFDLPDDLRPDTSVEMSMMKAHDQLIDALRSGQITIRGRKMGDPEAGVKVLSQSDCEQVMIREDGDGRQRAVIADYDGIFWDMLRFSTSDIMDTWPVEDEGAAQPGAIPVEVILNIDKRELITPDKGIEVAKRRRGKPPTLMASIMSKMRDAMKDGFDLEAALEKTLVDRFGGGRTTCRDARRRIMSEIAETNKRQNPSNDK